MPWFELSLPRAGWNTGLPFCKKSWHLQEFGSTEKMSHFPPEKENLWGGKKGKKNGLEKSNHSFFFNFSPNAEQRNSCLCLLSIPPAMSWANSNPGELLPAPELLWLWASHGRTQPAGSGRDCPHSSITLSWQGTNPAAADLFLPPDFSFIYLPLGFGAKVCFCSKIPY